MGWDGEKGKGGGRQVGDGRLEMGGWRRLWLTLSTLKEVIQESVWSELMGSDDVFLFGLWEGGAEMLLYLMTQSRTSLHLPFPFGFSLLNAF